MFKSHGSLLYSIYSQIQFYLVLIMFMDKVLIRTAFISLFFHCHAGVKGPFLR